MTIFRFIETSARENQQGVVSTLAPAVLSANHESNLQLFAQADLASNKNWAAKQLCGAPIYLTGYG
jgi:hypothetical protein